MPAVWRGGGRGTITTKGNSSIGRAAVSKTAGWGFKSLLPCWNQPSEKDHFVAQEKDNAESDDGVPAAQDPTLEVAQAAAKSRPVRKSLPEEAPAGKKDHATPKQRAQTAHVRKRATPVQFVRESAGELRKVVWPTATQLRQYFVVVLVFVLLMIAYVSALDLLFGWGLLKIFG
jgi:preprotein translocase subunit SecE